MLGVQTRRKRRAAASINSTGVLTFPFEFSEYEVDRFAAVRAYEAQQISALFGVRRFRDRFLGGKTLGPDEAYALVYPDPYAPLAPAELLDELGRRADELAKRYDWELPEAQWFLLTGYAPHRQPATLSFEGNRIHISAEPWVSAETVLQIYRQYQRYLLRGENRPIGLDKIALFQFVNEHSTDNKRPTWRKLLESWNSAHPEWRYPDEKQIARAFARVKRALLAVPVQI